MARSPSVTAQFQFIQISRLRVYRLIALLRHQNIPFLSWRQIFVEIGHGITDDIFSLRVSLWFEFKGFPQGELWLRIYGLSMYGATFLSGLLHSWWDLCWAIHSTVEYASVPSLMISSPIVQEIALHFKVVFWQFICLPFVLWLHEELALDFLLHVRADRWLKNLIVLFVVYPLRSPWRFSLQKLALKLVRARLAPISQRYWIRFNIIHSLRALLLNLYIHLRVNLPRLLRWWMPRRVEDMNLLVDTTRYGKLILAVSVWCEHVWFNLWFVNVIFYW